MTSSMLWLSFAHSAAYSLALVVRAAPDGFFFFASGAFKIPRREMVVAQEQVT